MKIKLVTVWEKLTDKGYTHNHIEDCWNTTDSYPLPKHPSFTNQEAWAKATWRKYFGIQLNLKIHTLPLFLSQLIDKVIK